MASVPFLVTSNEVKDESKDYETDCWNAVIEENGGYFIITLLRVPNETTHNLLKWKALMKKVATVSKVSWQWDHRVSIDKKSVCNLCIPLFCEAITRNTIITSLSIHSSALNNNAMKRLCEVLQTHTTITCAEFLYSDFSDSIGADLEKLIVLNNTLKTLAVNISAEEAIFVARALPRNSTLTFLNLVGSYHQMGNKGVRMLCEGLKGNNSITKIGLNFNGISDEGAKVLFSVLEVNHSINRIYLRSNSIEALPEGVAFLTHIKIIDIRDNYPIRFPPHHVTYDQTKLHEFFADYRYGPMKFHFLLGFHERVGNHSSIRSYLYGSSIFEPNLLKCIFCFLP